MQHQPAPKRARTLQNLGNNQAANTTTTEDAKAAAIRNHFEDFLKSIGMPKYEALT